MKIKPLLAAFLLLAPYALSGQKAFLSLSSGQYLPISNAASNVKNVVNHPYAFGNVTRFELVLSYNKSLLVGGSYQRLAVNNWEKRVQKHLDETFPGDFYRTVYLGNTTFIKNAHQISFFIGRSMSFGRLDFVPCVELGLTATPRKIASADIKAIGSHELITWESAIQKRRMINPSLGIRTKFYYPVWRKFCLAAQIGMSGIHYRQTSFIRTTDQISGISQSETLIGRGMAVLADGQIGLAIKIE
jgi:hypothetical protein